MNRLRTLPLGLVGLGAIMFAALLSITGVPVTSAQGQTVFVPHLDGALPVDSPYDPAWDQVAPVDVALSGQPVVPPMRPLPAFPAIRVRAMEDGDRIAMLLEWDDPTTDDSVLTVGSFADAAAVQFALGTGTSICMGQLAGGLDIWHWKADWAADLVAHQDVEDVNPNMPDEAHLPQAAQPGASMSPDGFLTGQMAGNPRSAEDRPSSVEDLNAIGFGTLTPQAVAGQDVHGASEHRDGTWRVVMSRALSDGDPNDAVLRPGGPASVVAFAVWDGSRGDRDGQKSVSSWLALSMVQPPMGPFDMWPMLLPLLAALILGGILIWLGARQPAVGLGWHHDGPGRGER